MSMWICSFCTCLLICCMFWWADIPWVVFAAWFWTPSCGGRLALCPGLLIPVFVTHKRQTLGWEGLGMRLVMGITAWIEFSLVAKVRGVNFHPHVEAVGSMGRFMAMWHRKFGCWPSIHVHVSGVHGVHFFSTMVFLKHFLTCIITVRPFSWSY